MLNRRMAFLSTVFIVFLAILALKINEMSTKVHTLKYPLIVQSDLPSNVESLLPAGTTLYFDKSYPEGFTRYMVYVNVDRYPLALTELEDSTEISPIDARPIEKNDLLRLLRNYPLSKSEITSILHSEGISKDEARQILREFAD